MEQLLGGNTAQRVLRLRVAGGNSYVLKAAPPKVVDAWLDWPAELEREIELYHTHPEIDPWRPKPLGDFRADGWRGLLMEDLGNSLLPSPWTESTLDLVAAGLAAMHSATAVAGCCLVHGDLRSDNLFIAEGRGLILCDWAEASPGPGLDDAIYWAIGVDLEGGGAAPEVFARYTALAGEPDPIALRASLANLARINQQRLDGPGLPQLVRELRVRELLVLRRWQELTSSSRLPTLRRRRRQRIGPERTSAGQTA